MLRNYKVIRFVTRRSRRSRLLYVSRIQINHFHKHAASVAFYFVNVSSSLLVSSLFKRRIIVVMSLENFSEMPLLRPSSRLSDVRNEEIARCKSRFAKRNGKLAIGRNLDRTCIFVQRSISPTLFVARFHLYRLTLLFSLFRYLVHFIFRMIFFFFFFCFIMYLDCVNVPCRTLSLIIRS